jgi:D-inositol-3-phosphate glycosyltransferase
MKVALIAPSTARRQPSADSFTAEQATHVAELGRALAARGHRVVIYARQESAQTATRMQLGRGLMAQLIPAGPPTPVTADERPRYIRDIGDFLAERWRRGAPDVVHAHHWTSGLAAMVAARDVNVPVVQTFGSLAAAERRHGLPALANDARIRLEAGMGRGSSGVIASTSAEAEELSRMGISGAAVTVVPPGVDTDRFRARDVARPWAPARLLAVGPLTADQDLQTVLRAVAVVPDAELVVAGGPAQEQLEGDGGYRLLAKLTASLGIAHRVRFTGQVSDDDLPDLLGGSSILVSAARYAPLGLTALRAMACGVPVVATSVGGPADAVIDGTTGMLVPPGRPDLMARRLRGLIGSPMQMTALGIAAADRARSRYQWDRVANETTAVYQRCAARHSEPAVAARPDSEPDETLRGPAAVGKTTARRAA